MPASILGDVTRSGQAYYQIYLAAAALYGTADFALGFSYKCA
jgi:hypothetical protein